MSQRGSILVVVLVFSMVIGGFLLHWYTMVIETSEVLWKIECANLKDLGYVIERQSRGDHRE